MKIVLKLTGKLFDEQYVGVIKEIIAVIKHRYSKGDRLAVVVGGGKTARKYISMGESLGLSNSLLDVLGIESSRINAMFLASALGDAGYLPIPRNIEEFLNAWSSGKVVVLGGIQPGQSTNAVAAVVAELVGADMLVNATVVDGVYDKDPSRYSNAKLLKEISIEDLEKFVRQEYLPGHYELLDPIALNVIKRSRINLVFTNAFKPTNILRVIEGDRNIGTWIKF